MSSLNAESKVYVAGHRGMVGAAVQRALQKRGCEKLVTATSRELDLTRQQETEEFLLSHRPDAVVIAAAKVGGIQANQTYPAEFAQVNLAIATNLIHGCHMAGVERVLFLGSSCIYPRMAPQPIQEASLLTGPLEETNEAYAIAKIAGLKLCEYYRRQYRGRTYHAAMPCNLYGPGDNYHPENSHVIPALLRRFHEAKQAGDSEVALWGSGKPLREFLYATDLADAVLHLLETEEPPSLVNIGAGEEISIRELAGMVAETVGFEGQLIQDTSKPDGTPRKLMDSSVMRSLGWSPKISLREGLALAYRDFLQSEEVGATREA